MNRRYVMALPPALLPMRALTMRCIVAAMVILLSSNALADSSGLQKQLEQIESGTLVIIPEHSNSDFHSQPPLSTDVVIDISGLLARASITQSFRNESGQTIEAIYAFPLPDKAKVDRMEMQIGERTVKGEIRAKKQARKEYSNALQQGKRASLLESHRANLFTNRVANIPPQETIQVSFSYQWQINYDDGVFGLRVPLTVTPRYQPGQRLRAAQRAVAFPVVDQLLNIDSDARSDRESDLTAGNDQTHDWQAPVRSIEHHPLADMSSQSSSDSIDRLPSLSYTRRGTPTSIFVTIDTALPLETVSSNSHDIHSDQTNSQWRVSLANGMVPTDRDFTLTWSPRLGHSPLAAAFTQSHKASKDTTEEAEHFASVMVIPPQDIFRADNSPREVIFVIDTSGSMQGNSIRQARAALQFAIDRLAATDTFNVIEFNSTARSLYVSAKRASDEHKASAIDWVGSLRADGGTEISAALDKSLGNQPVKSESTVGLRQVVFITDGSVGNEAELFKQIEHTLGHSRLFTVGIGSAPNTWFMRRAAETGRGTYTYIASEDQVRDEMRNLLQKLEKPVLTDITLTWDGIESPEVYPTIIPDLYAGEPLLFDARWQGDSATGSLSIQGNHSGSRWTSRLQIEPAASRSNLSHASSLEKQWVHRKIESMENSLLFAADPQSIKQQITNLALEYSMITSYTSMIAVDHQIVHADESRMPVSKKVPVAVPQGNTMLLPQGGLGIGLRLLLTAVFSAGAVLFGLATLRQAQTI